MSAKRAATRSALALAATTIVLLLLAAWVNWHFARRAAGLAQIPAGHPVEQDQNGYFYRSPTSDIRYPITQRQFESWQRNQNWRRLAVIPGLLALLPLVLLWHLNERSP
jgi:hypothetical protein